MASASAAAPAPPDSANHVISEQTLCKYLDTPQWRGSPAKSAWCLLQTMGLMIGTWWAASKLAAAPDGALALRLAFGTMWGLLVLRSYMIFHDCGHGSFFQGFAGARSWNWLTLHVSAVMCGTPTDWNVGHQLHHANVGNMGQDDYDWGETIFHTSSKFVKLPAWQQRLWKTLRHPLPFFILAPLLTWYFKMRLPFELRPERKAAYRFSDKMLSSLFMYARYKLAHQLGIFGVIFGGDYLAMSIGVLLFHWQHVFDQPGPGYVRGADEWKIREAAMHGSSMQQIPEALKYFTLGIEYHHIHHFRTRIPGYMLRVVHEKAPPNFWDDIVYMKPKDMWRSLFLQVWDEETKNYATFDEVLARHRKAGKAA